MTAEEIIDEIKRLPGEERSKVLAFARAAHQGPPLSPEQLGVIARKISESQDPAEADRLQQEFIRGFYGDPVNA